MSNVIAYSPLEERINILSHGLGFLFSIVAFFLLIIQASRYGTMLHAISAGVFGTSLIVLYAASTIYHSATTPARRMRLRILDHASIYVLIAGTYTPIMLLVLGGTLGWIMFAVSWSFAVVGIVLKLFFTGRYSRVSTAMYVLMGWLIIIAIKPLLQNFSAAGLWWLFGGGMSYTVGALIYGFKTIKFGHATFHIFVLIGSACHFVCVFYFVLPTA